MFGTGATYDMPQTGKRIQGFSARKSDFTLGWDNTNTLNDYQIRKKKNNDVVGKITETKLEMPKPVQKYNYSSEVNNYDDPRLLQYERLLQEYPDVPPEQLQKILMSYPSEQFQQQPPPKNYGNYEQKQNIGYDSGKKQNTPQQGYQRASQNQRRAPILPKQSMKDIIFSSGRDIGTDQENPRKVASRRNNSNLILGDGYNYFKN